MPTWNFVTIHLRGIPEVLSSDENLRVLDRLVARFEAPMPEPRMLWESPNDSEFVERLESGTVGFRLTPTSVSAKRKLSQNRPVELVDRIIRELDAEGPHHNPLLAAEMRRANEARV